MKYQSTLIAVTDMARSIEFYRNVLGLEVIADFGANVTLTGGIALQTLDSWKEFIHKSVEFCGNDGELYFEEENIEKFSTHLENFSSVEYVHPLFTHSWGQRVIRFYDPDHHIIEVGESLKSVVARFAAHGLHISEIAVRMDVSEDYVKGLLE